MTAYYLVKEHSKGYLKDRNVEYIMSIAQDAKYTDDIFKAEYFQTYVEAENSIRSLLAIFDTGVYKIIKVFSL